MKRARRPWTWAERSLFLSPLLIGVAAMVLQFGPGLARRLLEQSQQLDTSPATEIWQMALSRDGSVLAASGYDRNYVTNGGGQSGIIYLWDARTLEPLKSFAPAHWNDTDGGRNGYWVGGLSLSPDGKLVAMTGRDYPGVSVYDTHTQKLIWRRMTDGSTTEFTPDGRYLGLAPYEVGFEYREAHTGKVIYQWKADNGSDSEFFRLAPDGKTLLWISALKGQGQDTYGQQVQIRRLQDGQVLKTLEGSEYSEAADISPDGSRIVCITRQILKTSYDVGSTIRCYGSDGTLLWMEDCRLPNSQRHNFDMFCDVVFSPDGRTIAVRNDGLPNGLDHVLIYDAASGKRTKELTPAKGQHTLFFTPRGVVFAPDGKRLYARGKTAMVVWDLR